MTPEEGHRHGLALVQHHTDRFIAYVSELDDAAMATRVPGGSWTVGETVAHVQSLFRRYTVDHRRVDDRADLAARNHEDAVAQGTDTSSALASIREQLDVLVAASPRLDANKAYPFHGGQTLNLAGGWGNLLGELLAHGDDIARVTGSPFTIPSADLEVMWRFTGHLLEAWLRPDAAAHSDRWRLRFPFGSIDVTFDAGQLGWDIEPRDGSADHALDIDDAAEFALTFPYRRRPVTDATTALLVARFYDL